MNYGMTTTDEKQIQGNGIELESDKERFQDCLGCRLASGGGLVGISFYIKYQAKLLSPKRKIPVNAIALVFAAIGCARLFNMPPFKSRQQNQTQ